MKPTTHDISAPIEDIHYVHSVLTLLKELADRDALGSLDTAASILLNNAIYRMENLMDVTA